MWGIITEWKCCLDVLHSPAWNKFSRISACDRVGGHPDTGSTYQQLSQGAAEPLWHLVTAPRWNVNQHLDSQHPASNPHCFRRMHRILALLLVLLLLHHHLLFQTITGVTPSILDSKPTNYIHYHPWMCSCYSATTPLKSPPLLSAVSLLLFFFFFKWMAWIQNQT